MYAVIEKPIMTKAVPPKVKQLQKGVISIDLSSPECEYDFVGSMEDCIADLRAKLKAYHGH